jgi:hypothetical protein
MTEPGPELGFEEESIMEIFKVRMVGQGVGLTRDVLASELKWIAPGELDAALAGLVAKGLLSNPAFYQKIYLLTPDGRRYIAEHLAPV